MSNKKPKLSYKEMLAEVRDHFDLSQNEVEIIDGKIQSITRTINRKVNTLIIEDDLTWAVAVMDEGLLQVKGTRVRNGVQSPTILICYNTYTNADGRQVKQIHAS